MNSTYRERIETLLADFGLELLQLDERFGDKVNDESDEAEKKLNALYTKALTSLIREVAKSAKPERRTELMNVESKASYHNDGFNQAIDRYEQNIKELLGGSSD